MKKILIALALIVLAAVGFMAWKMMQPPPDGLDLALEKTTANGLYELSFTPADGPASVGPIMVWNLAVKDKQGNPVTGATVKVDGEMPQHGHGLPTTPAVTGEMSPGVYAIDGVKFSMGGWWKFDIRIAGPAGEDMAEFNVVLE